MADLRESLKSFQDRFSALPLTQRILVLFIPAVIFSLVVTLLVYSLRPGYTVLYSNLSPEDMNAVLTELDKEGVKYKVGRDGRSILVVEGKARDLRLKLAAKGIPNKGIIGYEIFDKSTIGLSEFQQRVNFKRAIEGELVRTILRMKNIEDARVHITLPEKSIFLRDRSQTSASVFIKLRPGADISPSQVKAIRNLVSASVENLKPEKVVVIDDRGRNLTAMLDEGTEDAVSARQFKIKNEFERNLERKIQTALESALGYGNVKVRVSAELDFTKVQKKEVLYDPDLTAVVSEQKKKERSVGGAPGGVAGTTANIPPAQGVQMNQGAVSEKKETITNYEVSKREIMTVDPTLRVKRISVGVMVNSQLKDVDKKEIEKIVSASAGIDPKRGDTLSVVMVPFKPPEVPTGVMPEERIPRFLIPAIVGAVFGLILLFVMLKILRRKPAPVTAPAPAQPPEEMPAITGAEILRERAREVQVVKTITEVARKEPKKVAALIKTWLKEE